MEPRLLKNRKAVSATIADGTGGRRGGGENGGENDGREKTW